MLNISNELMGLTFAPKAVATRTHLMDKKYHDNVAKLNKKPEKLTRIQWYCLVLECIVRAGKFVHVSEFCRSLGLTTQQAGGYCKGLHERGEILLYGGDKHYKMWGVASFQPPELGEIEERSRAYRNGTRYTGTNP